MHQTRHNLAAILHGDGNAKMGDAVDKVGGAVNGIHNPVDVAGVRFGFFPNKAIIRAGMHQLFVKQSLRPLVRHRDKIGRTLARGLQVFNLPKIPL